MKKYINLSSFGLSYCLKDSTEPENADIIISDDEKDIEYALNHNMAHIFITCSSDCRTHAKNVYIPEHSSLPIPDNDYIETVYLRHNRLTKAIAETERLIIRELSFEDMVNLPSSAFGFTPEMSEADRKDFYEAYYSSMYDFAGFGYYGFFNRENGNPVGYGGLSLGEASDVPNAGYFILEEARNRGYATEGMNAVLSYAEREHFSETIIFRISRNNAASLKVARRLSDKHRSVKILLC